jgi:3-deoxy-D-manno-octulosonic-acid transferase
MALCLLLPIMPVYLWHRARKQAEYRGDWSQRFLGATGFPVQSQSRMWVHAVSVGETHAIAPLVLLWNAKFPQTRWVFTSTTPTGRATAQQVFKDIASADFVYLPYDLPFAVSRFLREVQPRMGWLVETELWPNLLAGARARGIPMALLNARVSPNTARQLLKMRALSVPALARLSVVVTQTAQDADIFRQLGRPEDLIAGNLKFDVQPKPALLALGQQWRQNWGDAPVLLAASTREGEEPELLAAWQLAVGQWGYAQPRLLVVPRHPQRFEEVAQLFGTAGFFVSRRSQGFPQPDQADTPVIYLGDSMGEMPAYYACSDIAFMGGSWQPLGGQNLIEACACDCPVLLGPHTFNFAKAADDALAVGAALRFDHLTAAMQWTARRLSSEGDFELEKDAAIAYARQHRGAASKTFTVLQHCLQASR